ncbi:hypothetical protein T08_14965 [Trichinella sp. T8]|nr:hypothetical protein T08_14965 [Trichinella sp. T8]
MNSISSLIIGDGAVQIEQLRYFAKVVMFSSFLQQFPGNWHSIEYIPKKDADDPLATQIEHHSFSIIIVG